MKAERNEYFLLEEDEENGLVLLFRGLWTSLTDAFIGGGIVRSRDNNCESTYIMAHKDDVEEMEDDETI